MSEPFFNSSNNKEEIVVPVKLSLDDCYKIVAEDLMKKAMKKNDTKLASLSQEIIKLIGLG